jgi:hypothetical protein
MQHLHKWLKTKDYQTPTTLRDNPFTLAMQTDMTFFEYLESSPPDAAQFANHMIGHRLGRPRWTNPIVYPVADRLLKDFDPGKSVLIVDVGGNTGPDMKDFRQAFPDVTGRVMIQDLPDVIAAATAPDTKPDESSQNGGGEVKQVDGKARERGSSLADLGIETMVHDFFTPQPVHGARAYLLHFILHDWPDDKCVEIVSHLKKAMAPGYSKLLISEYVIPDGGGPNGGGDWETTYLDLYMMVLFGSRERTERDWRELLEGRCGLKITAVFNPGNGIEGVIECEVPVGV